MSEQELESLKHLDIPPPSRGARRTALSAAMIAYDLPDAIDAHEPQGNADGQRPTPRSHSETRRRWMTLTSTHYALAASVAALVVAAPLAFRTMDLEFPSGRDENTVADKMAETPAVPGDRRGDPTMVPNTSSGVRAIGLGSVEPLTEPEPEPQPETGAAEDLKKDQMPSPVEGAKSALARNDNVLERAGKSEMKPAEGFANLGGEILNAPAAVSSAGRARLDGNVAGGSPAKPAFQAFAPSTMPAGIADMASLDARDADALPPTLATQEFRDNFEAAVINPLKDVAKEPVSTFSLDVDTASYAFVRRALNEGRLPPKAAVRAEEMINYFDYDYPKPDSAEAPFKPTITVVPSPWNAANKLVHIGIKGYELATAERPRANLVLLVDVSGSMSPQDRLPLVKSGLRMMVDDLKPEDTVGIVTYASGSGIALEPTKVTDKAKILAAIDALGAGGSTAGAQGIEDAYRLAEQKFDTSAVNRVILATDGDFNVGVTNPHDLRDLIERKRDKGIFLSILGVGQGNYNDALMQTLAQNGNGVAAYADTLNEARRVLVDEASSTLFPIAKDVKIQVEWNPERVAQYRLIGYETRGLKREDFNNDKVDAGDVGSGHTVTAIYEVTPVGAEKKLVDDLRYAKPAPAKTAAAETAAPPVKSAAVAPAAAGELGFLKLRYKLPKSDTSVPMGVAISDAMAVPNLDAASTEVRFSVAVAGFAELLRQSPYIESFNYDTVTALAQSSRGADPFGIRAEFTNLTRTAKSLAW